MKYSKEEIKDRLLEEDYPQNEELLNSIINQFGTFEGEDEKIFVDWFESNRVPDFEIDGITPAYLRMHHGMKDAAIILSYIRLLKEPKAALLLRKPLIKHK